MWVMISSSPGERPPGGAPAFLGPGKREWPPTSPQRSWQQAAKDLPWIIERLATCADMIGRSTYKALVAIFDLQCQVREGKVVVKAKTGGDCIQNPSDADATYHWGCQIWFLFFFQSLASTSSTGEMPRRRRIQFDGAIYHVMASASPSPTGR